LRNASDAPPSTLENETLDDLSARREYARRARLARVTFWSRDESQVSRLLFTISRLGIEPQTIAYVILSQKS